MCKRNRNANKESLKPHRIPNPKTHWCFYENQMLKNGKFANWNELQNRKTENSSLPPPCICLFIRLITPPAKQIFNFLIKVVATNKQSEHREIPFFFPDFVSHHEFFFYYGTYRFFLRDREYFNL